ncbi:DNA recombination protein RmuC [Vulcaniibacterium tengchongense]|uniref:DNA recombination protein RmuC n=1 Tax=Vulcaniibacterium tengchongense TaxID=1273429 RepID=A0A3N4VAY9_9GAMM|nr:DNA recombination protein RmuC [Vulcaniibacterium tengchongense]RPE80166.1 DNA recombination protein RmuC [Vulcaniibacterium tengchongense]
MPDVSLLLLLLLIAVVVAVVLLVVLLLRRPGNGHVELLARLEQALREEQRAGRGELRQLLDSLSAQQEQRIEGFGARLTDLTVRTDQRLDVLREALTEDARKARAENAQSLRDFAAALDLRIAELGRGNELRLGEMRATLEQRLRELQADNAAKLEQMRATVDEKLHATLETRLSESFGHVAQMLAQVHQGLGDMSKLAADVGGLQRVLTNVKSRGIFGEVQLAGLLEQVFAPEQYAANVATVPGSNERVEYAVRFPGSSGEAPVWLPIDAKFPREDYERLLDAQERGEPDAARAAGEALERRVRQEAARIREKYVAVPHTTEFAILFLPTEGLYAEVLRRPGLVEALQREQRIAVAGPTTLLALMTSFQMGFRTLAIQERSSEVWRTLGAVKTEFAKFGAVLDAVKKKLDEASNKIDETGRRTRVLTRKLREVEALPAEDSQRLLGVELDGGDED